MQGNTEGSVELSDASSHVNHLTRLLAWETLLNSVTIFVWCQPSIQSVLGLSKEVAFQEQPTYHETTPNLQHCLHMSPKHFTAVHLNVLHCHRAMSFLHQTHRWKPQWTPWQLVVPTTSPYCRISTFFSILCCTFCPSSAFLYSIQQIHS